MASCILDNCCICIELKSGCLILGYINLVVTLIYTILTAVVVTAGAAVLSTHSDPLVLALTIVGAVMLISLIVLLVFVIVLLVGLHQNKPGYVKAYLIVAGIFLIIFAIEYVVGLTNEVKAGEVVKGLIMIFWDIYSILVIRSQYYRMKDPSKGPAIYQVA